MEIESCRFRVRRGQERNRKRGGGKGIIIYGSGYSALECSVLIWCIVFPAEHMGWDKEATSTIRK